MDLAVVGSGAAAATRHGAAAARCGAGVAPQRWENGKTVYSGARLFFSTQMAWDERKGASPLVGAGRCFRRKNHGTTEPSAVVMLPLRAF
jgi:hypothetical protein